MKKRIAFILFVTMLTLYGCSSNQVQKTSQRDKLTLLKKAQTNSDSLNKFEKTITKLSTQSSENIPGAREEYEEWAAFYFLSATGNLPALEAYLNTTGQ